MPPHISRWDVDTALNEVLTDGPQKDAAAEWLEEYITTTPYIDVLREIAGRTLAWATGKDY